MKAVNVVNTENVAESKSSDVVQRGTVQRETVQRETVQEEESLGTKEERSVFVVNFRKTMTREDVKALFVPFGKVISCRLPTDPKAKHRSKLKGFGYIEFADRQCAAKCIAELNNQSVRGKVLSVQHYRDNKAASRTVYVRGLKGFNHAEADKAIRTVLRECGGIKEIRLTQEQRTGKLRGFAYVEFQGEDATPKALKCGGTVYEGRVIEIKPFQSEHKREKQGSKQGQKHGQKHGQKQRDSKPKAVESKQSMDVDQEYGPSAPSAPSSARKKRVNTAKVRVEDKPNKSQDDFRAMFGL